MAGKGYGKGNPPPVNYNVPGLPHSSIDKLPAAGVAIFHDAEDKAMAFCEHLKSAMDEYQHGECKFENVDVSQVQWQFMSFSCLLDILGEKGASTKRLKAFKCGLDDDAIRLVTGWLEQLPPESMPREIHLSNNQITMDGLENLLEIIETKRSELATPVQSVWLRVENNKMDGAVIDELVAAGRVALVPRCNSPEHQQSVKAAVAMPSFAPTPMKSQTQSPAIYTGGGAGSRGGKGGRSFDAGGNPWDKGKTSGNPWDKDKNPWQKDSSSGDRNGASWDKNSWNNKNDWWSNNSKDNWDKSNNRNWKDSSSGWKKEEQAWPPAVTGRSITAGATIAAQKLIQSAQKLAQAQKVTAPVLVERPDRSRTPVRVPVLRKPDANLPAPWEKQWSAEYGIPYYWNPLTGDSLWEPPKA